MAIKGLDAGEFKRTVGFQQPIDSRDAGGSKERSFAFAFNCMAKIEPSQLRSDTGRGNDITPVLLHTDTIYIRYSVARTAIGKHWQVTYDGLSHVIHEIEHLGAERNEFIRLTVKAVE